MTVATTISTDGEGTYWVTWSPLGARYPWEKRRSKPLDSLDAAQSFARAKRAAKRRVKRCRDCAMVSINGVACHEHGCPSKGRA